MKSNTSEWNPLAILQDKGTALLHSAAKKTIHNILRSYTGFFDPFCESIQNGMDAIDKRTKSTPQKVKYIGQLVVEIDLSQNSFRISDNGCGFQEQEFKSFLAPHVSFKQEPGSRGRKGVGATYLAYGFNHLELGTKSDGYDATAIFQGGRKWVDDQHGKEGGPTVLQVAKSDSKVFAQVDRGSTFLIKFVGPGIRPSDLGWYQAVNAEQWQALLLAKTPLGHIELPSMSESPIHYLIKVIDRQNTETQVTGKPKYLYPHLVIPSCVDATEIVRNQQQQLQKGVPAVVIPPKFKNLNGVYSTYTTDELNSLLHESRPEEMKVLREYGATAYGFFCYSVRLWDNYNDEQLKLRKGYRLLSGGLQLATDNMPQGDLLTIPLTSNIGYQNQAHVVVHFENADPDLGRKGFQPELREAALAASTAIVGQLQKYRIYLRKDSGSALFVQGDTELHEWLRRQEEHAARHPLKLVHDHFFLPTRKLPIMAEPMREQDVVALFNQLVAGGVIRGIKLLATDQQSKYDGVCKFYYGQPASDHIYDKEKNPLGIQNLVKKEETSRPYVLEYKLNLDALLHECECGEKNERDIHLAIYWDVGELWKKKYSVTSLLVPENLQHRPFHGITHVFTDGVSGEFRFFGICLKELIEYLNDQDRGEKFQRTQYGIV